MTFTPRPQITYTASARKAALYARVSSRDQEKEGFSIPSQLKLLRGYADQEGLTIVEEFVDVETAKQTGRAGFGEMVAFFGRTPAAACSSLRRPTGSIAT